jgi:hypothetical protein
MQDKYEVEDEVLPQNGESQDEAEDYIRMFAETHGGQEHSVGEDNDDGPRTEAVEDTPDEEVRSDGAESPATTDGRDDANGAPDPFAWITELPEDVRQQAEALQQQGRTSAGRASALQRKVNELQARLEAREELKGKGRDDASRSPDNEEDPATLQEFMEKYPSLAKSVQSLVRQEAAGIKETMDSRYGPIYEEVQAKKRTAAAARLEDGAAELFETERTGIDYREIVKSDFYRNDFLANQPAEFQQIANTTQDPDTALWVLQQFKAFADKHDSQASSGSETSGTKSRADQASQRRSQARNNAASVKPKSAPADMEQAVGYEAEFQRQWGSGR